MLRDTKGNDVSSLSERRFDWNVDSQRAPQYFMLSKIKESNIKHNYHRLSISLAFVSGDSWFSDWE